ncbi:hypothetical protein M407DRAFT_184261 [Tulasnella calospora MUT 4182]|uniref:Uncharacterized protein n=1 Tax=Tulasnella calospora MUT 4182 TaxID=1051891 RepID=A0A0C3QL13_9AGAM|nr:hypothetical protein M407DRAFT_184261 [Tulasnella calospora MUT 4182]
MSIRGSKVHSSSNARLKRSSRLSNVGNILLSTRLQAENELKKQDKEKKTSRRRKELVTKVQT